ncbi:MAG: glycosyltransferase [Catenulispora sp.]|nr:glycosyltransferase [Catenulispora sp.]
MPYYGDVGMMQEAVRSVLAQRDPHWRLTVVDDGTEPGVPEWFADLIADHGPAKIHYLRNETNLGITENFQKCLSLVTQPLVTMIGSDDRMLPNYVGTVRALMKAFPQVSLAQPGVEVIDENGEIVEPWVDKVKRLVYAPRVRGAAVLGGEALAVSLLRGNWMYFPAICWRADVITEVGFNPDLRVVQDLALTLEWVRAGAQIVVADTICFQYRRHSDSVSSARAHNGARFAEEGEFFLDEARKMERLGWRKAARAARLHLSSRLHAAALVPGALRRGSRKGARTLAGYAFGPGWGSERRPGGAAR